MSLILIPMLGDICFCVFFNDTATTEIYTYLHTLSLLDALPICAAGAGLSSMADRYLCRDCSKPVTATTRGRYRTHTDGNGDPCAEGSGREIPEDLIMAGPVSGSPEVPKEGADLQTCTQCDRKVKLTRLGYFDMHDTTMKGGERCEVSGVRARDRKSTRLNSSH